MSGPGGAQGSGAGGGGGGGRGQGQNSFQYRPQRQFQGNFHHNQYRGQFYGQYRGQNPYQNYHQQQYSQGNQNFERDRQLQYNQSRSLTGESSNPNRSVGQVNNSNPQFVPKPTTSSGGVSTAMQKEKAAGAGSEGAAAKLQCFRCWNHGDHVTKDCKADVLCVNCDKTTHISSKCAWLHQKKPIASFVGFGGEGLGVFVAEHTKETTSGAKGTATALIKIKDSTEEVSAERLELGLASTYPWRWAWKAKNVAAGAFLVSFPSVAKITEAEIYDWVPLKQVNIMVNIKLWTDESLAAGKLTTVWVKAKGVPKTLKNFHGLCEVGSTLGQHIEADMEELKKTGQVRLKVGVVSHLKIPKWTQVSTPKLHYYRVYFQLEEIVEMGWDRPEEEILQDFEDVMDSQPEGGDDRDPKRLKGTEATVASPSGQLIPEDRHITASTRTRLALEQRELNLREQDEEDFRMNMQKAGNTQTQQTEKDNTCNKAAEHTGENTQDPTDEDERVRLSDEDMDGDFEASQSESFGTKVKAYGLNGQLCDKEGDVQNAGEDAGPRFSGRLASKNPEDVSVMERAQNIKAKNLDKDTGIGRGKIGATTGRKAAGTGRG